VDNYGTLTISENDADLARNRLVNSGSIVFTLSSDGVGATIVLMCGRFEKIGIMPFGGNPEGRCYVGVYGRGCNHLGTHPIHPAYIEEKLGVQGEDAEALSKFWSLMWRGNKDENN
jgi:hypothetical protein